MNYFIMDNNNVLNCFYYGADRSIYQRTYLKNKWSRAICVISDVRKFYSVFNDNNLSIICQDTTTGDIILCHKNIDVDTWENRVLLESKTVYTPDMRMTRFNNSIIYNIPDSDSGNGKRQGQTLVIQRQNNNKWQKYNAIDNFVPLSECMYRLVQLKNNKALLIYRKNMPEQRLGFRVIDENGNVSDFKTLYTTGYIISDFSVAEADDGILHFVLSAKGRFSSQLIYIRATEQTVERNFTVLWEGNNIEYTAVSVQNGKIIINHSTGGRRYYTFVKSSDGGDNFKGIDFKHINFTMKKAYIIGETGFNGSEIIVSADRPYDIESSICSEMCK